jgi:hypothetical protein
VMMKKLISRFWDIYTFSVPLNMIKRVLKFNLYIYIYVRSRNREYCHRDPLRWHTFYPQKLTLTSPTSDSHSVSIVHSRTNAMEFFIYIYVSMQICICCSLVPEQFDGFYLHFIHNPSHLNAKWKILTLLPPKRGALHMASEKTNCQFSLKQFWYILIIFQ